MMPFEPGLPPKTGGLEAKVKWLEEQVQKISQASHGLDPNFDGTVLGSILSLTDPGADRIVFWDESANAAAWLATGTGLAISGTTLSLSFLGLEALTDPNADRIPFWDDSAGAFAWLTVSTGLSISGTSLSVSTKLSALENLTWAADQLIRTTGASAVDQIAVAFGGYAPTLTGVTNVAASGSPLGHYIRIGDRVTVAVQFTLDPTAAVLTTLRVSLPIASNLAGADLYGSASTLTESGRFTADAANDEAEFNFTAVSLANQSWFGTFMYVVK